jgi:hypothetical protein
MFIDTETRELTRRRSTMATIAAKRAVELGEGRVDFRVDNEAIMADVATRLFSDKRLADVETLATDSTTHVATMLHDAFSLAPDIADLHAAARGRISTTAWMTHRMIGQIPSEARAAIREYLDGLPGPGETGDLATSQRAPSEPTDAQQATPAGIVAGMVKLAVDDEREYTELVNACFGWSMAEAMRSDEASDLALRQLVLTQAGHKLVEYIGAFRESLRATQRTIQRKAQHGDVAGVHAGDDIRSLLPTELALLALPETQLLQMRKLQERQTLMYDRRETIRVKRGPVCIMLDTSGSMSGEKLQQAIGMVLAVAVLLTQQGRAVTLVQFHSRAFPVPVDFRSPEGAAATLNLFLRMQATGGTNFNAAFQCAAKHAGTDCDFLLLSDGQGDFTPTLHRAALRRRKLSYVVFGREGDVVPDLRAAATSVAVSRNLLTDKGVLESAAQLLV